MLTIYLEQQEFYDDATQTFRLEGGVAISLEHSLVSLSKWESEYEKPFLSNFDKTVEETLRYIELMALEPLPSDFRQLLTNDHVTAINNYINKKSSATTFGEMTNNSREDKTITSEVIYFWMNSFNIPIETEAWNINRLFNLIKVHSIKNQATQSGSRRPTQSDLERMRKLNEERRKAYNTSG